MGAGQVLSTGSIVDSASLLITLVLVAAVSCALDWMRLTRATPWIPVGEALIVALILANASPDPALLIYLAVPPIVAGVRHGLVTTFNAALVGGVALVAAASTRGDVDGELIRFAMPWLVVGLGAGLLASWQSRSTRDLAARQAPYAATHRLMARLHQIASAGTVGLDAPSLATELGAAMRSATGAARCAVFVVDVDGRPRPVLAGVEGIDRLAAEIRLPESDRTPGAAVVPLRGVHAVLGYCVLVGVQRWTTEMEDRARDVADEFAVRLDTAVLFDEIRHLSAAEERNRIARDMHDGVAQEIVALGYVVDEIESISQEPDIRVLAASLRDEITRVVSELRYSIFDLRHHVDAHDLTAALTDYVQEVSRDTDLRVHLVLDTSGPHLPGRAQSELLRIAQEAISNVRRHARATNLWVTLVSDGTDLRLEVSDDGIGDASPRDRHWGLQTMQERARGIGAAFAIEPRPGGGTVVRLLAPTPVSTSRERSA